MTGCLRGFLEIFPRGKVVARGKLRPGVVPVCGPRARGEARAHPAQIEFFLERVKPRFCEKTHRRVILLDLSENKRSSPSVCRAALTARGRDIADGAEGAQPHVMKTPGTTHDGVLRLGVEMIHPTVLCHARICAVEGRKARAAVRQHAVHEARQENRGTALLSECDGRVAEVFELPPVRDVRDRIPVVELVTRRRARAKQSPKRDLTQIIRVVLCAEPEESGDDSETLATLALSISGVIAACQSLICSL
jgi:hypothetical protein